MALTIRYIANDIKGVELEPLGEITNGVLRCKQCLSLIEEPYRSFIHKGFVLDQS